MSEAPTGLTAFQEQLFLRISSAWLDSQRTLWALESSSIVE